MKERPIIFSGDSVRAIIDGRKTQTRRPIKDVPRDAHTFCRVSDGWVIWCGGRSCGDQAEYDRFTAESYPEGGGIRCPYGQPGDRLWVRETWAAHDTRALRRRYVHYRADDESAYETDGPWISPIHMPRWASRLLLEVTDVRVQQLQEISEQDAQAEGVEPFRTIGSARDKQWYPEGFRANFKLEWDQLNSKVATWSSNPWVWAISFRRVV